MPGPARRYDPAPGSAPTPAQRRLAPDDALLATYASALIILAASLAVGRAIWRLAGGRETSWLEPVIGFAALALTAAVAVRAGDSGSAAFIAVAALTAASVVVLRGRIADGEWLRVGLPVAVAVLAVASIPFLVSGRIGILGVGVNNDLASHFLWAWWLQDQPDPVPVGLKNGYPIGPHAMGAALGSAFGFSMLHAMTGLLIASVVITGVAALAIARPLGAAMRAGAGVLIALPYLAASAFAIGGFKEAVMAMFLLGFALGLWRLERDWPSDRATAVGLAVIFAGTTTAYSAQGTFWLIAAAGLLAIAGGVRALRARELGAQIRRAVPVLAPAVVLAGVLTAFQVGRMRTFQDVSGVSSTIAGDGKLRFSVSPLEGIGAWPSSDFLLGASDVGAPALWGALGVVALAIAVAAWLRRGSLALPLALVGAGVIYAGTLVDAGLYVQSKALAVPSPLVMTIILGGLLGLAARRPSDDRPGGATGTAGVPGGTGPVEGRRTPPTAALVLAGAFAAVAAYSTFLALRDAVVAPNERAEELAVLRDQIDQSGPEDENWVLSLTSDRFTDYQFRSVKIASPNRNAQQVLRSLKQKDFRLPVDFDTVDSGVLDAFQWVLSTSAEYRSRRPPNLELVDETAAYELWRRTGPTPPNVRVFGEEARPGKVLGCTEEDIAQSAGKRNRASEALIIDPPPVIGKRGDWSPDRRLIPGESATQTLRLPRGTWNLSLQYHSPLNPVVLSAPGYREVLSPAMDGATPFRLGEGPFWKAGRIETEGGPVQFTVEIEGASFLQGLLGADREAAIGNLVATKSDAWKRVPFAQACNRYVDHYYLRNAKRKRTIELPPKPLSVIEEQAAEKRRKRQASGAGS